MMTNPIIHTLVFVAAVVIPGGLLVYFAWRACNKRRRPNVEHPAPSPEEAKKAFLSMYPADSLRARERWRRLDLVRLAKTRPKKNSQ